MAVTLNESIKPFSPISVEYTAHLKNTEEKAQNDVYFKQNPELVKNESETPFFDEFKSIVEAERKKTSACLGRIAHDKTRAQMKLMALRKTYGVILNSGDKTDGNLLREIEAHKTFIRHCLEQSTLVRDRLLRLETSLKTMLLSKNVSEHPENTILEISNKSAKSAGHSKNQCSFWHQATKQRLTSEQQEAACESIPSNRM